MAIYRIMTNHPNRGRRTAASNPLISEIRAAREAAALTQKEAGALIYASCRAWEEWESGRRKMHPAFWQFFLIRLKEMGFDLSKTALARPDAVGSDHPAVSHPRESSA
jgi:putative transcriptional regulator